MTLEEGLLYDFFFFRFHPVAFPTWPRGLFYLFIYFCQPLVRMALPRPQAPLPVNKSRFHGTGGPSQHCSWAGLALLAGSRPALSPRRGGDLSPPGGSPASVVAPAPGSSDRGGRKTATRFPRRGAESRNWAGSHSFADTDRRRRRGALLLGPFLPGAECGEREAW